MKKQLFKKIVLATALSLMTFGSAAAVLPTASAEAAGYNLSYGMSGASVTNMQQDLIQLGYLHTGATGYYGSATTQAVRDFQAAYSLSVDGIYGPITETAVRHAVVKQSIVADTWNYVGTPYKWGGTTPSGFDCSGFVNYIFNKHGVDLQRVSASNLYQMGYAVSANSLKPGDLVFYSLASDGHITHVGIYLGNGKMMSATSSKGIYAYPVFDSYWGPKYVGARRVY